ncbi:MAG: 3-methyl-2-oxobutanoate hydroxymethyltransferase [Clostridiales bacterium]|nr:3-methyl-2-oxobutanoate hydroxymethyltransferase [Clostridiales bacterium]
MAKINISHLYDKKKRGEKIVAVTAYDYPCALVAEAAGADILLVGDSLGNVVLGYESTMKVTMADILHHARPVARAAQKALVVADMPFGSYQISVEEALRNAVLLLKEAGVAAVKLEGGAQVAPLVAAMTGQGIPVMAHIGLLPQTAALWHGYRVQGCDEASAREILKAALALEQAGAFSVVLECVASEAAALITEKLNIPTIGIGSGPHCDGQVLVFHDLVGLNEGHVPRFVKRYGAAAEAMRRAVGDFAAEVRQGLYPGDEHSFPMNADELKRLY